MVNSGIFCIFTIMKKWIKEWDAILAVYVVLASIIVFQMYYIYQLKQEIKTFKNEIRKRG